MFGISLMKLVGTNRMHLTLNKVSGGGIHKARNNLAHDFLKSPCERILWADSDVSYDPENVFQLWARDLDLVAAPYAHKAPNDPKTGQPTWAARSIDGIDVDRIRMLQEVSCSGTGFLLVKRHVFERIMERFPEGKYIEDWNEGTGETKYDFFREGVVHDPEFNFPQPTFLTEDFYFCYLARKCGFKVYVDCTSYVRHWEGSRSYPESVPVPQVKMPDHVNETDILNFQR